MCIKLLVFIYGQINPYGVGISQTQNSVWE